MAFLKPVALTMLLIGALYLLAVALAVLLYAGRTDDTQADAAIVLGAGVFRDRPSPVLRERINHAVGLYHAGDVSKIIFTGGAAPDEPAEAVVAREYAMQRGVPAEAILVEITSTSTVENLTNALAVANDNGLDTFLIVSTPYHMKRAIAISRDLGMTAYTSPTRTIRWISWRTRSRAFIQEVGSYTLYLFTSRVWRQAGYIVAGYAGVILRRYWMRRRTRRLRSKRTAPEADNRRSWAFWRGKLRARDG